MLDSKNSSNIFLEIKEVDRKNHPSTEVNKKMVHLFRVNHLSR